MAGGRRQSWLVAKSDRLKCQHATALATTRYQRPLHRVAEPPREVGTRRPQRIAIVLIDIDRFRLINDTPDDSAEYQRESATGA